MAGIGIFSGKGGVGKTTLVANLGAALSNVFNRNVVIFDNNIHTSHLGLHFGLYEDLPVTLKEVLKNRIPITQAVYIHPATGVRLIPAPLNGEGLFLTKEKCCSLVNQVKGNYDIVIVDCAPGLGGEVLAPMHAVDEALVVSTPDIAALTDAMKSIEILKRIKKNVLGIVLNRYRHEKYELTPQEISSTTNYNIVGIIPEDNKVPESISKGLPVVISHPNSKASIAFKKLAATLINQPYEEETFIGKLKKIFGLGAPKRIKPEIIKPLQPAKLEPVQKEVSDLTAMKAELLEELKEEVKKELMKKVRKKLEEKMHAQV